MKKYALCLLFILSVILGGCSHHNNTPNSPHDTQNSTPHTSTPSSSNTTVNQDIDLSNAQEIALSDADLTDSEVTFIKGKRHQENGIVIFDIEFVTKDKKYDYEIQADTGRILENHIDVIESVFGNPSINSEAAKEAALNYAGVSKENAVFVKVELDHDDDEYDIEFYSDGILYECEVSSFSGNVIKMEKEYE